MVINLDKRFIFVANLKSASTAIERVLCPESEIAILESRFGKHLPYRLIEEHFYWIFHIAPKEKFFVFGVMRDPVEYLLSLYNSHRSDQFKDEPKLATNGMSFDDFISVWRKDNEDQMVPQHTRFLDGEGKLATNYLISYDKLSAGLEAVGREIGVENLQGIGHAHCSKPHLQREMLDTKQLAWIYRVYWKDFEFLRSHCDRVTH